MNVTLEYKCFAKRVNCVGNVYVFAYKQIIDDKKWYGLQNFLYNSFDIFKTTLTQKLVLMILREQQWNQLLPVIKFLQPKILFIVVWNHCENMPVNGMSFDLCPVIQTIFCYHKWTTWS